SALRALIARDLDVYVIQVLSQAEIDPDLKGDLRLVDVEDQAVTEVSVSPRLLDKYRRTLATFIETAREFSARRGISYMMTSTDRPVERLISRYLRQRGLVR
ncbi:MAG: DUF58 domain-containing protein, partial [Planctomycetota bacterium]